MAGATLNVMHNSLPDIILGQKLLKRHDAVTFDFGGAENPLVMSAASEKVFAVAGSRC